MPLIIIIEISRCNRPLVPISVCPKIDLPIEKATLANVSSALNMLALAKKCPAALQRRRTDDRAVHARRTHGTLRGLHTVGVEGSAATGDQAELLRAVGVGLAEAGGALFVRCVARRAVAALSAVRREGVLARAAFARRLARVGLAPRGTVGTRGLLSRAEGPWLTRGADCEVVGVGLAGGASIAQTNLAVLPGLARQALGMRLVRLRA